LHEILNINRDIFENFCCIVILSLKNKIQTPSRPSLLQLHSFSKVSVDKSGREKEEEVDRVISENLQVQVYVRDVETFEAVACPRVQRCDPCV
jgi:hypothetical protein